MDALPLVDVAANPIITASGESVYQQPSASANEENVERVKGKWGEDLNTAFQYEKYTGEQVHGAGDWASSATRYEWNDEFESGDIAPRDEKLERQLFGDENEGPMGINFNKYLAFHLTPFYKPLVICWFKLGTGADGRYDQINVTYKSTEKVIPIMKVYDGHPSQI